MIFILNGITLYILKLNCKVYSGKSPKGWLPYYVSKRAIEDLTIGLSQELAEKGIQVNAVSPSDTGTEQYQKYFPEYMVDAVSPVAIAEKVLWLCSDKTENITGKVFIVKKGQDSIEKFHG